MYKDNLIAPSQSNIETFGKVKTISKDIGTSLNPVELFDGLSRSLALNNNMLLESSEIDSKENLKSILMLKAAVRIECNQQQVVIEALTPNGESVIEILAKPLKSNSAIHCIYHEKSVIAVEFK
ncbi:MAG: hypothetical protein OQK04_08220, partial [Kangiellaceae bacterium]|nr:hypothetical protein [Kangiellaceae bacterium]